MFSSDIKIVSDMIPLGWSLEAADFTNKLLKRKVGDRLGSNGYHEIKNHPWLKSTDWNKLFKKNFQPPFVPKNGDNYDSRMTNKPDPDIPNYNIILDLITKYKEFGDFYYDSEYPLNKHFDSVKFINPHLEEKVFKVSENKKLNSLLVLKNNKNFEAHEANHEGFSDNISSLLLKNNNIELNEINQSQFIRTPDIDHKVPMNIIEEISN